MTTLVTLYMGTVSGCWRDGGTWRHSHALGSFFTQDTLQTAYQAFYATIINEPGYDRKEWDMSLEVSEMLALKMRHPTKDKNVYFSMNDFMLDPS